MTEIFDRAATAPVERVARVLAGHALSRNGEGDMASAVEAVDALFERGHGHSAVTSTADRPPSTGSAAPVM